MFYKNMFDSEGRVTVSTSLCLSLSSSSRCSDVALRTSPFQTQKSQLREVEVVWCILAHLVFCRALCCKYTNEVSLTLLVESRSSLGNVDKIDFCHSFTLARLRVDYVGTGWSLINKECSSPLDSLFIL